MPLRADVSPSRTQRAEYLELRPVWPDAVVDVRRPRAGTHFAQDKPWRLDPERAACSATAVCAGQAGHGGRCVGPRDRSLVSPGFSLRRRGRHRFSVGAHPRARPLKVSSIESVYSRQTNAPSSQPTMRPTTAAAPMNSALVTTMAITSV